jgi:phage terminase small subunit
VKELKPKQKLFAEYYCGKYLGNAEKAAIAAGYSPKYARGNAHKLVANSCIKAYIEKLQKEQLPKELKIATIQEIQAFWSDVMNSDENDMKHRLRAAELLAKAKGAFNNDW